MRWGITVSQNVNILKAFNTHCQAFSRQVISWLALRPPYLETSSGLVQVWAIKESLCQMANFFFLTR